jgi:hypothetical protein
MTDPSTWDPALDAVIAPKHHKVLFENDRLRVLDVILGANDEEPVHHHRWPSVLCLMRFRVRFMILHQTERSCLQTGMS